MHPSSLTETTFQKHDGSARILICDALSPAALEVFEKRGFNPEVETGMDEARLLERVDEVDALVIRSATKITRAVIERAKKLRVIGRAGVGVDNVDCDAATENGVVVMNTPTGNTTTTGELAIALLCSLARHIPRADRGTRSGNWSKKALTGTELTGKTLGIVGFGRIGRVVAERALGLKLKVLATDPFLQKEEAEALIPGIEFVTLDEMLPRTDFVTLHMPLTDSTRNLFSRERLATMKHGVRIINAARGGLIDEAALAEALDSGQVAGAALDVLAQEPPSDDHPLLGRDDVILTPHLGASSHEAQHNVAIDVATQICDFIELGVANNAVNVPAVSAHSLRAIAPYVRLAEKMGSFLAQRSTEPLRKLEITISGELAKEDTRHLPLAVLVGLLRTSTRGVNMVNAPILAKEHGLRVLEATDEDAGNFQSLIKVRGSSRAGEESRLVVGTVFGRRPRFVRVDDLHLDFEPAGPVLITEHEDQPGVLGQLGTLLGEHAVNIRRLELGAPRKGDNVAIGILCLDEDPDDDVLAAVRAMPAVRGVQLVRL